MTTLAKTQPSRSPLIRWARSGYLGVAWAFVLMVFTQVFLIGMTLFVGGSWLAKHIAFGHLLGPVVLLLLVLALVARLPRKYSGLTLLLVVLFSFQYVFVNLSAALGV